MRMVDAEKRRNHMWMKFFFSPDISFSLFFITRAIYKFNHQFVTVRIVVHFTAFSTDNTRRAIFRIPVVMD